MTVAVRYALKIAYDGTRFSGSQRQPQVRTVDGECLFVLRKVGAIEGPKESRYQSASRTDAGVSAVGNVIAFNTDISKRALPGSFNSAARDVWALGMAVVPDDFNARGARQRWYRYHLPGNLDLDRAKTAAELFEGTNDFRWFTRERANTVKTIDSIRLTRAEDFIRMDVRGQSFLWGLIRRIAACVSSYCLGGIELKRIEKVLAGEKGDFGLAPPEPLVLVDVDYGFEFEKVPSGKAEEEVSLRLQENRLALARWSLLADKLSMK